MKGQEITNNDWSMMLHVPLFRMLRQPWQQVQHHLPLSSVNTNSNDDSRALTKGENSWAVSNDEDKYKKNKLMRLSLVVWDIKRVYIGESCGRLLKVPRPVIGSSGFFFLSVRLCCVDLLRERRFPFCLVLTQSIAHFFFVNPLNSIEYKR